MKKTLFLLFALILVLGICLTACGGSENGGSNNTPEKEENPTHTHAFGEWITTKNATCTDDGEMARYCDCGEKQTETVASSGEHKIDNDGYCSMCNQLVVPTEGIVYSVSADGTYAEVVGYTGSDTKIRIADTYQGLPVKSIRDDAFQDDRDITHVIISDSVTTVGIYPFSGCSSITTIEIGKGVSSIGYGAFYGCLSLKEIKVNPNNQYYTSINGSLYTKDGKTLVMYALAKGDKTFVTPDSVTSIAKMAFSGCSGLESVVIGDNVTFIDDGAFSQSFDLKSVKIGNGVTSISTMAFLYCKKLTSIVLGENVTVLANGSLSNCKSLTSIVIPDGVTVIDQNVFSGCNSLSSIVIPDSLTSIGYNAFYDCTALTDVYYTGTEEEWNEVKLNATSNDYLLNATIHFNYVPEE